MDTTTKEIGMTTTTADLERARKLLADARIAYEAFAEAMQGLGYIVRDIDEWQYQRVDAYPGWTGSRDVGGGADMMGWLDEIDTFLEANDPATAAIARERGVDY